MLASHINTMVLRPYYNQFAKMNSSSGQGLKHSHEQTIKTLSKLDSLIQQTIYFTKVIMDSSSTNQDHADEKGKQKQNISQSFTSKKLLKLIILCEEECQAFIDYFGHLNRQVIPGLERSINKCKFAIEFCKDYKQRVHKIIEEEEEIAKKIELLAKTKAEKLAKQAQMIQKVINMHEQLHNLQGKYRVFCKILPTPQNPPKPKIIQRLSSFSIKIMEKITHFAKGVTNQLIQHSVDYAFQESVKQKEVFRQMLYLLRSVFVGQTCSIMSYGQSGSGKSYTLIGQEGCLQTLEIQQNSGLIPRILEEALLMRDKERQKGRNLAITLQFFEKGYTPKVLQSGFSSLPKQPKSPSKKTGNKSRPNRPSQSVNKQNFSKKKQNAKQYLIKDLNFALQLLKAHVDKRKVAQTDLNLVSSRSHLCIILRVIDPSLEKQEVGMLSMIDLAGHQPSSSKSKKQQVQLKQQDQQINNKSQYKQAKQQIKLIKSYLKQPKQQKEVKPNPETAYINNSLNQVAKVLRLIKSDTPVVWSSYPYLMRYLQPYLEKSKGIVIVTLSSKKSGEQANRTSMKFIKDIQ